MDECLANFTASQEHPKIRIDAWLLVPSESFQSPLVWEVLLYMVNEWSCFGLHTSNTRLSYRRQSHRIQKVACTPLVPARNGKYQRREGFLQGFSPPPCQSLASWFLMRCIVEPKENCWRLLLCHCWATSSQNTEQAPTSSCQMMGTNSQAWGPWET